MNNKMIDDVKNYLLTLQNTICRRLEDEDGGAVFHEDRWEHQDHGGGGITRVIANGAVFEQGGVNFSHVRGSMLPPAITANKPELIGKKFEAMGVSLVLHPRNPYVPTTHLNVRFFVAYNDSGEAYWWFGGGYDLTPYYGFIEDCQHWHQTAYNSCQPFGAEVYANYKKQCDEYFFLKHRNEARGIGGIFFDYLNEWEFEKCFEFMRSVGDQFITAYLPIVQRRKLMAYGERERQFQLYRRGRYVEFNLIYDKGTLFGLQFGGRTESILMSLPPLVSWKYNWSPAVGSEEEKLYKIFLTPQNWLQQPLSLAAN